MAYMCSLPGASVKGRRKFHSCVHNHPAFLQHLPQILGGTQGGSCPCRPHQDTGSQEGTVTGSVARPGSRGLFSRLNLILGAAGQRPPKGQPGGNSALCTQQGAADDHQCCGLAGACLCPSPGSSSWPVPCPGRKAEGSEDMKRVPHLAQALCKAPG